MAFNDGVSCSRDFNKLLGRFDSCLLYLHVLNFLGLVVYYMGFDYVLFKFCNARMDEYIVVYSSRQLPEYIMYKIL